MSTAQTQLISPEEITDLNSIREGLYGLIYKEEEVNPIQQRPILNSHPSLLERVQHSTDSSGRWAFTLYLIEETGAFSAYADAPATLADWILRAFLTGRSSAIHHRDLAFRYLSNYDHLFHMIQWTNLNGYVRFKTATIFPIRNRIERIGGETEENAKDLGDPPDPERIISLTLSRHYLRFATVRPGETTTQRYAAQAIVEACNLGLLYQSIREETPLLSEVHALYMT